MRNFIAPISDVNGVLKAATFCLGLFFSTVHASDFAERAAAGNVNSMSSTDSAYPLRLRNVVLKPFRQCLRELPSDQEHQFRLVADVLVDGRILDLQTDIDSALTRCVVASLKDVVLPPPPRAPFPLTFEMVPR